MPFAALNTAAIARALSQLTSSPDDVADAYLERRETLTLPGEGEAPGIRLWREEGLAVRLLHRGRTWLASRDGLEPDLFADAVRQVARRLPAAAYPAPRMTIPPWKPGLEAAELYAFPTAVQRALRERHVAFPLKLSISRHRRWLQVVGVHLVPGAERESFYSCTVDMPWGRFGTLLPALGDAAAEGLALRLLGFFRARETSAPEPFEGPVVLGPEAAAVLLHEAVAHALEADTLALGGRPEKAVGLHLGGEALQVVDDPTSSPGDTSRATDDEGITTCRRWLLRQGRVEQPLADSFWAQSSKSLLPGAARRGSRHLPPVPRTSHLEVLPGEATAAELLAEANGGLYLTEARRGSLDPLSGEFRLELSWARRIEKDRPGRTLGPCRLVGRVGDLLATVQAVGAEARSAGAGWCAKGGQKMPVWATTPPLLLSRARVTPL